MNRKDCRDCVCLIEGDNGEWICDECEMIVEKVKICPEGIKIDKEHLESFMRFRELNTTTELIDYITYLEDVQSDHIILKAEIERLQRIATGMY